MIIINFMRSKCLYFTLLFSFITVESAFKMASIQVLFNSISLCVTTQTVPLAWTVI